MTITRRDFMNGVAISIAAGLSPMQLAQANPLAATQALYYPPALTGLRGSHQGSFENAHRLARRGERFDYQSLPVKEHYDLVVVGAGISGLAAAWFYRKQMGSEKKILLIDNHNDFGGHALRNEFSTPDRLVIGYGGSESFQSPHHLFSDKVKELLDDVKVSIDGLASHFDVNFYPDMGLAKASFFDKENFGVDKLVVGDPSRGVADDIPAGRLNGRSYREFVGDFPLPQADREALIALFEDQVDYLAGMSLEEKVAYADKTSYAQFLKEKVRLSPLAAKYFQQTTNDFQAVGIDATACADARLCSLPGFGAAGLPPLGKDEQAELDDLYIYHFPDGNASIARLLVQKLIPEVSGKSGMEDIVLAHFDYSQLDKEDNSTRLRLNATGIHVENIPSGGAELTYVLADGTMEKVGAEKIIMAGYNMMIPHIVPSMPDVQRMALLENVKFPLVYSKVVLRNWHAFAKLGVHKIYSPTAPYSVVKLDYPVSMGGYEHSRSPDEPICLHMIYVPTIAGSGLSPKDQARMGRARLLSMPFAEHEGIIRHQLQAMLGSADFDHEVDILGITVNRWSHGYSYYSSSMWDEEGQEEKLINAARQPFGHIHIANSDSDWNPYAHAAIDQAWRCIEEIMSAKVS
ncbi:MAG: NAD(P)-binding protein [Saezia sp.]